MIGCSKKPTINEAELYLEAKALETQLSIYKQQLVYAKKSLTEVIPVLEGAIDKPTPLVQGLVAFLEKNECENKPTVEEIIFCYKLTRLNLIHTTSELEKTNNNYYASRVTIEQLINNINVIIDSL